MNSMFKPELGRQAGRGMCARMLALVLFSQLSFKDAVEVYWKSASSKTNEPSSPAKSAGAVQPEQRP